VLTPGFFEIEGPAPEILPLLASKTLKSHGVVYFADFGDGTIKVGMTRGAKSRVNGFLKTAESYGKGMPIKFGISPILDNHELVEKLLHRELAAYWVERELFRTTEQTVKNAAEGIPMFVLRSCKWPACKGYFNHYGKQSVRPTSLVEAAPTPNPSIERTCPG